jgi:hypothetical protein
MDTGVGELISRGERRHRAGVEESWSLPCNTPQHLHGSPWGGGESHLIYGRWRLCGGGCRALVCRGRR